MSKQSGTTTLIQPTAATSDDSETSTGRFVHDLGARRLDHDGEAHVARGGSRLCMTEADDAGRRSKQGGGSIIEHPRLFVAPLDDVMRWEAQLGVGLEEMTVRRDRHHCSLSSGDEHRVSTPADYSL